jgi:hypothetical protein
MFLLLAGGAIMTFLKAKWPKVASYVLYGIGTLACLSIIFYAFAGRGVLSPPRTEPSNVEANVKKWCSNLGMRSQAITLSGADFAFRLTLTDGVPVTVAHDPMNRPGYLQFQSTISIGPEHRAALAALNASQATEIVQEVQLELSRVNVGYGVAMSDPQHLEAVIVNRSPVISGMTEGSFAEKH